MIKILILGATGFIGRHIAQAVIGANFSVYGLCRNPNNQELSLDSPIICRKCNLNNFQSLQDAMIGMDVVFHSVAFYPKQGDSRKVSEQVLQAETEIQNVIQAAFKTKIKRIIYTSSLTTIGHPPPEETRLADERDSYLPGIIAKSGYYESKIAMENIFLEACNQGLPEVSINPTAVFGPGDSQFGMGGILIAVARGWMPGEINVVDVRDVAKAHINAKDYGRVGERYIVGGEYYSIREALSFGAELAQRRPPCIRIPLTLIKFLIFLVDYIPSLPIPTNHLSAICFWQGYNTIKAQKELQYTSRTFRDTVNDTLEWYCKLGYIK